MLPRMIMLDCYIRSELEHGWEFWQDDLLILNHGRYVKPNATYIGAPYLDPSELDEYNHTVIKE